MKFNFRVKLAEVFDSRNALVSILSIILLAIDAQGISIGQDAVSIIDSFQGKEVAVAITVFLLNFITPITKLVQKILRKEWTWDFLRSENFQAQVATAISMVLINFLDADRALLIAGFIIQTANFVWHLISPPKYEVEVVDPQAAIEDSKE